MTDVAALRPRPYGPPSCGGTGYAPRRPSGTTASTWGEGEGTKAEGRNETREQQQQQKVPNGNQDVTLELSFAEFLRRFCLHLLPARFVKIRHYGLLANSHRQKRLALAR